MITPTETPRTVSAWNTVGAVMLMLAIWGAWIWFHGARADELRFGVGQLMNNRGNDPWLFEATAQKDHVLGKWDARLSFSFVQHGSFGGPDGGEQNLSLYTTLPVYSKGEWRARVGPGIILAHHWPASRTSIPDQLSVKQCIVCGVTFESGLDWRHWSLELRYWHTDPNSYPAHNGVIAVMEYGL